MKRYTDTLSFLMITVFAAAFIWGCASAPNPALESAKAAYEQAKATPGVLENAAVPMHEAEKSLKKAMNAEEEEEITHLAALAQKRVEYAVTVAEKEMAEKTQAELEQEKQKVLLDTRQKQIEKARKETEAKQRELEVKAREIELARQQAETARKEAEAKAKEAELARQKAENLEKELSEMKARKTDRGLVLTLGDVLFASGKSQLMPGAGRTVDKLAAFLAANPGRNIVIEGHTDDVGSDSSNLVLSQRRADAVRTALLSRGIDNHRIITKGYGESYPVAGNSSAAGRQQNRRVEIIILDEGVKGESIMRQ
ncbi:MAG: OmpA family protein [Desulfococcaceae bacterium]|nr:OmpA family protein [Desulfococcaceae bacterium]